MTHGQLVIRRALRCGYPVGGDVGLARLGLYLRIVRVEGNRELRLVEVLLVAGSRGVEHLVGVLVSV